MTSSCKHCAGCKKRAELMMPLISYLSAFAVCTGLCLQPDLTLPSCSQHKQLLYADGAGATCASPTTGLLSRFLALHLAVSPVLGPGSAFHDVLLLMLAS